MSAPRPIPLSEDQLHDPAYPTLVLLRRIAELRGLPISPPPARSVFDPGEPLHDWLARQKAAS